MPIVFMTAADVPLAHAIQNKAFEERWHEPLSLFESMYAFYPKGCFLIYEGEELAGYIFLHPADEGRGDYETAGWKIRGDETALFIHDICIDPAFQGQGLAQRAVEFIEETARANGFEKLIGIAIEGVEKFWQKQGYRLVKPYLYSGEPATFMEK